jgi:hypothetical protein
MPPTGRSGPWASDAFEARTWWDRRGSETVTLRAPNAEAQLATGRTIHRRRNLLTVPDLKPGFPVYALGSLPPAPA